MLKSGWRIPQFGEVVRFRLRPLVLLLQQRTNFGPLTHDGTLEQRPTALLLRIRSRILRPRVRLLAFAVGEGAVSQHSACLGRVLAFVHFTNISSDCVPTAGGRGIYVSEQASK